MGIARNNHLELLADDFAGIYEQSRDRWADLDGAEILLTGGTGFFGTWLSHSLLWILKNSNHRFRVTILCRNPERFLADYPYFSDCKAFSFLAHDVNAALPSAVGADFIIHAATTADARLNAEFPLEMIGTIVEGTRNLLNHAVRAKTKRFLFASSGAVYGKLPFGLHVPESSHLAPDTMQASSAYGEAKRQAELLGAIYSERNDFSFCSLRCFAFVGPFMSFDRHYAIGNFIDDSVQGRPILIKGDHRSMRSYMYGSDMARTILSLLTMARNRDVINVGSDIPISIGDLAETTRSLCRSSPPISYAENRVLSERIDWYVPDIHRLKFEYELAPRVSLSQSIQATGAWLQKIRG